MDITVKFSGKEYHVENIADDATISSLKARLYHDTRVKPEHQRLMGIKTQQGKPVTNETLISQCALKPRMKIMMMGSVEEDIVVVKEKPTDLPEVKDDLNEEAESSLSVHEMEVYQAKVQKRIEDYKIKELNALRPGKRLLVLDVDYTLFDHKTPAERPEELARPHLHSFLTRAYKHYDIVIWSATSMKWIEAKMKELGVLSHPDYVIAFMLDDVAMISVHIEKYNTVEQVKPLGVIWGKYPDHFGPHNTIMFDDVRRNFLMNPQSGLKIAPFKNAHQNRDKDDELLRLAEYLELLAEHEADFTKLDHRRWAKYVRNKTRQR